MVRRVEQRAGDAAAVVAGVGSNDTRHAVHMAERAAGAGADALLLVTPYYNKPTQAGVVAHCRAVADATDLPVMLYDIPGRTGIPFTTETLVALAEHPRIAAVKDAKGDLWESTKVMATTDLRLFSGADELNLPLLALGAAGVVSVVGHVAGEQYAAMVDAVDRGDLARGPPHPRLAHPRRRCADDHVPGRDHGQGRPRRARRHRVGGGAPATRGVTAGAPRAAPVRPRDAAGPMSHPHPDLDLPEPLVDGGVRVVPLGGLGEIGRNMTVVEHRGQLLVIDCGVLFPDDHHPGIDLILPDFEYIKDRLDQVQAVILTHGHEDHIGAVPYLLRLKPDLPLVGSTLTLALVEAKLKEHRIRPYTLGVREGDRETLGVFDCEFVAVNHSIPDALAVAVRTSGGTLLHTGDFKMDQLPLDGRLTDLRAFARLGEEGVDLFLTDSTNAEVPGFTTPEREISSAIDKVFRHAERRIIVACFSSHVHRVQQVLDAAERAGRKVAMVGRSMVRNMGIAADLGYLKVPDGVLVDVKRLDDLRDDQVVLICTGSQGEPMAALSRMANRDHRIDVGRGDTVLMASSLIPGNENAVYRVINGLMRLGAQVVHKGNAKVHVSGHASAGELLYCYNIVKPRNVMPVHGEWRHLVANAELAIATGVPRDQVVVVEDGVVVDLVDGRARVAGAVPCGYVYVDGSSVGEADETLLKDRRILRDEGFISVIVVVDSMTGKVVAGPEITARGFVEDDVIFDDVMPQLVKALDEATANGVDAYQLQQVIRRSVGGWVGRKIRRRPMIIPMVVEA